MYYIINIWNYIIAVFLSVEEETKICDEPKFVIFYKMVVEIFQLYNPSVEVCEIGTMASVTQICNHCGRIYKWKSQPSMFGRHPAGNVMLSFGILTSGAKIRQVLLMFKHMGLSVISLRTYFYHQKKFHFPVLLHHWETQQSSLLDKVKDVAEPQWSGDDRFDSMGHSAKYGV